MLVLQCSSIDLCWMSSEHNLDLLLTHSIVHLLLRISTLYQSVKHVVTRLGNMTWDFCPANSVMCLCDPHQVQIMAEGTSKRNCFLKLHTFQFLLQLLRQPFCCMVHFSHPHVASTLCQKTNSFHPVRKVLSHLTL